jgi:hypothetical protein
MQGAEQMCPLYLYSDDGLKVPNFDKEIWNKINEIAGETTPENILDYIYAVLHSPKYRETYKEFLKIDFPRVPYPNSKEDFWKLVPIGTQLRELHLLEASELQSFNLGISFIGDGEIIVEKPVWKDGKVYINKDQYFDGIEKDVFDFYIGGYQPAQKWLKDRKGRTLTSEDIIHYKKMCVAMKRTIEMITRSNFLFLEPKSDLKLSASHDTSISKPDNAKISLPTASKVPSLSRQVAVLSSGNTCLLAHTAVPGPEPKSRTDSTLNSGYASLS